MCEIRNKNFVNTKRKGTICHVEVMKTQNDKGT